MPAASAFLSDGVLPTLLVVVSWLALASMIAGCGYVARRSLLRLLSGESPRTLHRADLWIGVAALLGFLQIWSVFGAISWEAWLPPTIVGFAGFMAGLAAWRATGLRRCLTVRTAGVIASTVVGILWLANRALGAPTNYDLGLYHLGIVEYASRWGTIEGLGNLDERLAAGDAHLLLTALLGAGPWSTSGLHLANGLLVAMLFVDIGSRCVAPPAFRPESFTRRTALLLVPATLVAVGLNTGFRLSSPDIDVAAFVLVAVGAMYLTECANRPVEALPVLASTASLAAAASTRPLYWLTTMIAVALVVGTRPSSATDRRQIWRLAGVAAIFPLVLSLGWMIRQALLSGYPLFPLTIGGLPVDWRMPVAEVHEMSRAVESWARRPARPPEEVLASWAWVGHWFRARLTDIDIVAPLVLLATVPTALACRSTADRHGRRTRRAPLFAVLAITIPTLAVWFAVAPDPRFAQAPLWLVPIALVAWAHPDRAGRVRLRERARGIGWSTVVCLTVVLAVALSLATRPILAPLVVIAVAVVAWLPERAGSEARRFLPRDLLAQGVVVACGVAFVGALYHWGSFLPVRAEGAGPLGTPELPTPAVEPFATTSRLRLVRPTIGDRCFRVLLCTPEPDINLRRRGSDTADGFVADPP